MSSYLSRRKKASHVPVVKPAAIQSRLKSGKTTKLKPNSSIKKVHSILQSFVYQQKTLEYQELLVQLRDSNLSDTDLHIVLEEASQCIPVLTHDLQLFVEAMLSIEWTKRGPSVISEYQAFLVNLLSAHNCHTKYAIDKMVQQFLTDDAESEWINSTPKEEDCFKYVAIHWVFNILLEMIPMCKEILLKSLQLHFPYFKKSAHTHEVYIHNLLWILEYQPKLRSDLLRLIVAKLVLLDVNAPREEIEKIENESECDVFTMDESVISANEVKHPVGHSLDICMDKLFNYFIMECHDECGEVIWDKTKSLYHELLIIFDEVILPTYNTHHVQYLMFTLCNFKTAITEVFLNYLWKKVTTPTVAMVIRQSAASYLASLIARGTFVPLDMLKGTLQQMAAWIHSYIASQDGNEFVNADIRIHGVFYCICQALFYVVAFRQRELVATRKQITFLHSLNMAKMVTCRLNPLRVIQPSVAQNFASVARNYQLAYCYSIMEHNSRHVIPIIYMDEKGCMVTSNNVMEAFFPFDPYILKRSGQKIWPFYVSYQKQDEAGSHSNSKEQKDMEDDDFLDEDCGSSSSNDRRFSYGTSPGFKDVMMH